MTDQGLDPDRDRPKDRRSPRSRRSWLGLIPTGQYLPDFLAGVELVGDRQPGPRIRGVDALDARQQDVGVVLMATEREVCRPAGMAVFRPLSVGVEAVVVHSTPEASSASNIITTEVVNMASFKTASVGRSLNVSHSSIPSGY